MSKRVLFLVRGLPLSGTLPNESLDLLLVAAAFDVRPSVLVLGEAIFQLLSSSSTSRGEMRDVARAYSALPVYDVERVYVDAAAVARFRLDPSTFTVPAECLDEDGIRALIASHDVVLSG